MSNFRKALGIGSILAAAAAASMTPTMAPAKTAAKMYVACNQYGDCWRVRQVYAYGEKVPIRYYNADWYEAHRSDANIRWLDDPVDDRGYYIQGGTWHEDPGARAVKGGAVGAGLGAAIGCLVTLPMEVSVLCEPLSDRRNPFFEQYLSRSEVPALGPGG